MINRTVSTLQKWDRAGVLPAKRTATNRRYYTQEDYSKVMNLKSGFGASPLETRKDYTYSRVSLTGQSADLKAQSNALDLFCIKNGIAIAEHLSDIGSGLNYKRKNFVELMKWVEGGLVDKIVIAHKDRLVRFGFEWFESFCQDHGSKIIIMNHDSLSPQEEMTKDLLSIIHCFSSRLYGLRRYKKELKKIVHEQEVNA
jgi:predicted site-specific integrase-resolvase